MRNRWEVRGMMIIMLLALVPVGAAQTTAKEMGTVPGIVPSSFGEAVDRDVLTIRSATAQFKATEDAEAAGYKQVTDCVQHQPAGAMGYHFQNNALLDTTLDLEHPEVLVYEKLPDGTFQLNGVEFLVPISAWKSTEPPRIMGQNPYESRVDWLLVPSRLDVEAGPERPFRSMESRRQVPGADIDESLGLQVESHWRFGPTVTIADIHNQTKMALNTTKLHHRRAWASCGGAQSWNERQIALT